MTKVHWSWLILATIAIMLLGWRFHLLHNLVIEQQQQITQELLDTLDLHSESLKLLGDRTSRTQGLAIRTSLALREAAADLTGASNLASDWFRGCVE